MTYHSRHFISCSCTHKAPALRELRSVEFNKSLAKRVDRLSLSGDATVDRILTELLESHTGRLFDANGAVVRLDSAAPADIARWDALFSQDQRRWINRFKERASRAAFKNRLQMRLVYPVSMMFFALEISDCRTRGACSRR